MGTKIECRMDFIISHFGYIALTLVTGVIIGWATFPVAKVALKPLKRNR